MIREVKITHLELFKNNSHHYFGSMAAIYSVFSREDIGIAYTSLRAYGLSVDKEYRNNKCVIRQGILITAPQKNPRAK